MSNASPKLYRDQSEKKYPSVRLGDEEYGRAIQSLVVVCTDIVVVDTPTKTIYLPRRASRPASGKWWFVGGRSFIGETEQQSAQRCFRRETGLLIEENRFEFICMNRYFFADRQQIPQDVGCDSLCYTFSLQLTEEERSRVVLDPKEYQEGGLRAFGREDLQTEGVQQCVRDVYKNIFGD